MQDERELLKNSDLFDGDWYLETFLDVAALRMDPVDHYLWLGAKLMRDPGPQFSTRQYLSANPDVAAAGLNPLVHYLRHGVREGRRLFPARVAVAPPPSTTPFDADIAKPIVFIAGEATEKPGYNYRIERYADAFTRLGETTVCLPRQDISEQIATIRNAKLIIIWRAAWRDDIFRVIEMARSLGIPTVFDIDDLMIRPELATAEIIDAIRYDNKDPARVRRYYKDVAQTMVSCDFATTTTEELAWHMRRRGPRRPTFVLPNGYDEKAYSRSRVHSRIRDERSDDIVRIGYASGSRTHQRDFDACAEAVAAVLRRHDDVRLVLFQKDGIGMLDVTEFDALRELEHRIEWRNAVPHDELPQEIARFDINLAPLEHGNPFCEAKSELKFFEAAIADVPTVASPTGPFARAIQHGVTGLLASTSDEWLHSIETLIANPELRTTMGREAHRQVLWTFGPTRRAELAQSMLEHLKGGRSASRAFYHDLSETAAGVGAVRIPPRRIVFSSDKKRASRVTVIVPLYNYARYIEDALESAKAQTMPDLDLIVVDDCSTDDSLAVVLRWLESNASRFNRALLVQHEQNNGLGLARNTAVDLSDTLYFMALDADNRLRPECCTACFDAIHRSSAAFAYPIIQQFGDAEHVMGNRSYHPADFIPANGIDAMAMISKEVWSLVGGYSHSRLGWQDYDFWCRVVGRGLHGVHVARVLADYRVHQRSMLRTSTDRAGNKMKLLERMESDHPWLSLTAPGRIGHRSKDLAE